MLDGRGGAVIDMTTTSPDYLDNAFEALIKKNGINTAGVALINDGKVVWQNQFGLQSEGKPASSRTLFNVASLTKPVVAETVLRLVDQGELSLDESIASYWIDPDLENDPRVKQLTPRMLLTHTSGFPNWRYFSEEGKLAFVNPPGEVFGYSGEGFEYLAKYVEYKLDTSFDRLVQSILFDGLKMQNAHLAVDSDNFTHIAKPIDENGEFYGYYCNPYGYCASEGSYSAAANLVITVADYARFLIASMQGAGLSSRLKAERDQLHSVQFDESDISCTDNAEIPCPYKLGYGLGWSMSLFQGGKLIGHRGTNWKAVTLAYYYPESQDGLVILFNAPNKSGLAGMIEALGILDPDSPEILGYQLRLARTH